MGTETKVREALGLGGDAETGDVIREIRRLQAVAEEEEREAPVTTVDDAYRVSLRAAGITSALTPEPEHPRLTAANAVANIAAAKLGGRPPADEEEYLAVLQEAQVEVDLRLAGVA